MNNTYGDSPLSSNPPSAPASKYQTNIGRTKTRKWVEAKVQNYDGDDWGNEYDEEEPEEQPPMPAQQGTWPRQPVNQPPLPSAAAGSASGRPLLPSESPMSSPRNLSGPPALHVHTQQPTDLASRTSETDSPWRPRRSFPSGVDDAARREPARSPPPTNNPTATLPSSLPSPQHNVSQGRQSPLAAPILSPSGPAPNLHSAAQVPTRFPPRKSSMGQQEGPPDLTIGGNSSQSGSNPSSRPVSGASHSKPWMEARSASPQGPRSPPPTNKPLPFVRPADIYRRMEEEKERERVSLDSSRPSLDSSSGRAGEKVESLTRAQVPEQSVRSGPAGDQFAVESPRGSRTALATVAERRSEYGLESYLVDSGIVAAPSAQSVGTVDVPKATTPGPESAGAPEPTPEPVPAAAPAIAVSTISPDASGPGGNTRNLQKNDVDQKASDSTKLSSAATHLDSGPPPPHRQDPETGSVEESEGEDIPRRFSTSPTLPDFSRMSSFGVDLFGSSFGTTANDGPHQPEMPTIAEHQQRPTEQALATASPLSQIQLSQSSPSPAASYSSTTPSPGPQNPAPFPAPAVFSETAPSAPEAERSLSARSSTQAAVANEIGSRSSTPPSAIPQSREAAAGIQAAEPSPLPSETQPVVSTDAVEPSATPSMGSGALGSTGVLEVPAGQSDPSDGLPAISAESKSQSAADDSVQETEIPREASRSSTPRDTAPYAPPPVEARSQSGTPEIQTMDTTKSPTTVVPQSVNVLPASAPSPTITTHQPSGMAPLSNAPPNSSLATEFEPPDTFTRTSTLNTTATGSPVKESDKLREEIMKSLSPPQSGGEFAVSRILGQDDRNEALPRESTYLGDVYDDYYGISDDKAEDELLKKPEDGNTGPALKDTASSGTPTPGKDFDEIPPLGAPSMSPRPLSPHKKQPSVEIPALRQRFSWEAGPEQVNSPTSPKAASPVCGTAASATAAPAPQKATPEPEPKSLSIVPPAEPPIQPPPSVISSPISPAQGNVEPSPTKTVETSASKISHQVSQASTLPPGTRVAAIEPPSPISVLSDDRNAPIPEENRLMTLAEEKSLITSSSVPVSPHDGHPALETTPPATAGRVDTPPLSPSMVPPPVSPMAVKIMPFKEIMTLPTPSERIERLDETRVVFSKIDSGLDSWLDIMTQLPEHTHASWSLRDNLTSNPFSAGQAGTDGAASGGGAQLSAQQQPYYQQYLNASNPNLHAPLGGSGGSGITVRPLSGLPSSQFSTADFRNSGKEVGAKGKELLMAAGKAGKGLFSKGKSKLRGTGDKVFF